MSRAARLALAGLLAATGCGGGSSGSSGPPQNAFTGTLTVSSASSATSCQGTLHTVTFLAAGVDNHTPAAAGGECVLFVNGDTADHQPAPIGTSGCPELSTAPSLSTGGAFTAGPFDVARSCTFEDALNPPSTGGGGGGGY